MTTKIKTGRRPGDKVETTQQAKWERYQGDVYRCLVYLIPEEDEGFSVIAAHLPGAASQGDNEQEALSNITEALRGVIDSYKESGHEIPWQKTAREKTDPRAKERWVIVHA